MHQAYWEPRELDHRHMDGGEPTDRNGLPRKRGCTGAGAQLGFAELVCSWHRWWKNEWEGQRLNSSHLPCSDRALHRVPLVIHQTGTPSFPGEGVVLEGHWGFSFQL